MQEINSIFAFSFGGAHPFGKVINAEKTVRLDFPSKPTGFGFAIRNQLEFDSFSIEENSDITYEISISNSTVPLNITIEFKTFLSGNAPEKSTDLSILGNKIMIATKIPKLSSKLKEIVFFIPLEKNSSINNNIEITFNSISIN